MSPLNIIALQDVLKSSQYHATKQLFAIVRPTMMEAGAPAPTDANQPAGLMDILNKATTAPATTSLVTVPPVASLSQDDIQNLQDISLLDTYVSVAASLIMYKAQPGGWDITTGDGAASFTKALANARFKVITEGLAGFLSMGDTLSTSFNQSTTSASLHLSFLSSLFSGFGFDPASMAQLDSVMTNITQSLANLQLSWSDQNQTLDHLISLYYFQEVQGLDAKIPMMRLFYLHIDQHSWTASVGKSSVAHFNFNMNYTDNKATMSLTQMAANNNRTTLQNYITEMTNQQLAEIKTLTQPKAIQGQAQPS